jgi:hypothetical protein
MSKVCHAHCPDEGIGLGILVLAAAAVAVVLAVVAFIVAHAVVLALGLAVVAVAEVAMHRFLLRHTVLTRPAAARAAVQAAGPAEAITAARRLAIEAPAVPAGESRQPARPPARLIYAQSRLEHRR